MLIIVAVAAAACGYVRSGTWDDAPPLEEYAIWVSADDPQSNFRVLIDRETGHIFLADYQV